MVEPSACAFRLYIDPRISVELELVFDTKMG